MPRNPIESVEIVEPPLRELSKTGSSFKRGCLTGCLFFILIIALGLIGIKILIGAGPTTIKTVPYNFPPDIPIYDRDNIEQMTFIPGKYKYRSTEIAAFFPKILLSPVILRIQGATDAAASTTSGWFSLSNLWQVIRTPVSNLDDTVEFEWQNLDAEPDFVYTYYRKELEKKHYAISDEVRLDARQHFSFSRSDGLSGFFVVEGDATLKPGTDYAALTVNIPHAFIPSTVFPSKR